MFLFLHFIIIVQLKNQPSQIITIIKESFEINSFSLDTVKSRQRDPGLLPDLLVCGPGSMIIFFLLSFDLWSKDLGPESPKLTKKKYRRPGSTDQEVGHVRHPYDGRGQPTLAGSIEHSSREAAFLHASRDPHS